MRILYCCHFLFCLLFLATRPEAEPEAEPKAGEKRSSIIQAPIPSLSPPCFSRDGKEVRESKGKCKKPSVEIEKKDKRLLCQSRDASMWLPQLFFFLVCVSIATILLLNFFLSQLRR
jgi:hypothetical protein